MNDQNLIPNSARSPIELREQTKRGGIASGKSRKEKASLRKAAQDVLNGTYKDKTGQEFDGAKVVILNLFFPSWIFVILLLFLIFTDFLNNLRCS